MASASHLSPLEAYVSPDELADELVLQKTLLFTLDNTTEGSERAEADIKAEIARIETQLRALRGGVTGPHIGASVLGGSIPQQQQTNNFESASPFSSYNRTSTGPFSCEFFCMFPRRKYSSHHFPPIYLRPPTQPPFLHTVIFAAPANNSLQPTQWTPLTRLQARLLGPHQ